ncbi:transposase [Nocardioides campestrisoli]|uniref:transposase n=1 Tax=Nocardioides campestrisoli TaxID=2736757 RepID=UPI0015E7B109|nr:transposase [Nocardioides campestrisoli]
MSADPDAQDPRASRRALVLTVDQRDSRTNPDAVGPVLRLLGEVPVLLPFQRTAGDEFQGVLEDPAALPRALEILLRDGRWHVGLGLGDVETPLPDDTREARGSAFLAAREAVSSTRTAPWALRVVGESPLARHLESACWLWAAVLGRRTAKGWEVADLVDEGNSYEAAGRLLGVSQSAVSQRAAAAGLVESRRARELVGYLAGAWLGSE